MASFDGLEIDWLGHSSFRIVGDDTVLYIDPWKLQGGAPADIILISHEHGDHLSPDDIDLVRDQETEIVAATPAAEELSGDVHSMSAGERLTIHGVEIEAVPAYNVNKFREPGVPFHPKEAGHVGFIISIGGQRVYFAGDTDIISTMAYVEADIALLPVSGKFVMTADEAAEAAEIINPKVAIPMHYGAVAGSDGDARRFKERTSVPVHILDKE